MDVRFKEQYKLLPTVKLVAIAGSDTSEYRAEAIDAARNELKGRGETWDNAEIVKTAKIAVNDARGSLKRIPKTWIAFFLGVFSFVLLDVFVPETTDSFSTTAVMAVMAAYFFVCQFLLSRGNIDAHRKDWSVMMALDGFILFLILGNVLVERHPMVLSQVIGLLIATCGGTYAGAMVASIVANRTTLRP